MSILEKRNLLVQQNIPKLIKLISKLNTTDENYNTCIQFTYSHLKYHRFLSVNSHEIKREIDGICEKLRFCNFNDHEKIFKKLVEESVNHELAVNHLEKDVIYSIFKFLITLAYDPITNLRTKVLNGEEITPFTTVSIKEQAQVNNNFECSLLNYTKIPNPGTGSDSELSQWSDSDEDLHQNENDCEVIEESASVDIVGNFSLNTALKPPENPPVFGSEWIENSDEWLRNNIQNSFWADNKSFTEVNSNADHPIANFFNFWQKHLSEKSLGFIKPLPVSLISEYCLLREIFWMFSNFVDCTFFKVENDELYLRPNATLPSTMPESLRIFLVDIVRSLNLMQKLKAECLKSYQSHLTSHTTESYYKIVQAMLNSILDFVLEEESTVALQQESYTVLQFHNKFRKYSKMLEMLWDFNETSILDYTKSQYQHLQSAFLLASLNHHVQISCIKEKKNLATVLLIECLQTYLKIYESSWTQNRIDDFKMEFLIEKFDSDCFESDHKSPHISDDVSKRIADDPLIAVLMHYSVKASLTLDTISKLDRVHEMRQMIYGSVHFHDEFLKNIQKEICRFSKRRVKSSMVESRNDEKTKINSKLVDEIRCEMLANGDGLLLHAFESTFDHLKNYKVEIVEPELSSIEFYEDLNNATELTLPPLQSVQRIINNLLGTTIAKAERFVLNIFFNEFQVHQILQEIRKVFFIESYELMNFFNVKVFPQIEAGDHTWANPYLLTVALNNIMNTNSQNVSTLFSVEIKQRLNSCFVIDAVDGLTVLFKADKNLDSFFTPKLMQKYNDAFRFFLKIKWAQEVLSCLSFPDFFKRRAPYAKMYLIDLIMKRLFLTRFKLLHAVNSLHSHFQIILSGLSAQLDCKMSAAKNIFDCTNLHESFVTTFHKKLHLDQADKTYGFIIEVVKLVKVLREQWSNVSLLSSLDESGRIDDSIFGELNQSSIEMESAFGTCELHLKELFSV